MNEARDYRGVHLTLVGLRGVIAPPLAVIVRGAAGVHVALGVSALFALSAAALTRRAARRVRVRPVGGTP